MCWTEREVRLIRTNYSQCRQSVWAGQTLVTRLAPIVQILAEVTTTTLIPLYHCGAHNANNTGGRVSNTFTPLSLSVNLRER